MNSCDAQNHFFSAAAHTHSLPHSCVPLTNQQAALHNNSSLTLLQILTPTVIGAAVFLSSYFIQMPEAIQLAAAILAITGGSTLFLLMVGILAYVYGETLPDA